MQIRLTRGAAAILVIGFAACSDVEAPSTALGVQSPVEAAAQQAPFIAFGISASELHTCALAPGDHVQCWGWNASGQVGGGTAADLVETPVRSGEGRFTQVSAGGSMTCALDAEGAAWCWGSNTSGALGDGTTSSSAVPVAVDTDLRFVTIGAGANFACGLTADGAAWCWGAGGHGQLGIVAPEICEPAFGLNRPCATRPVAVTGDHRFVRLETGLWNACGLTADGTAWCWGNNAFGQLGIGQRTFTPSPTPTAVAGGVAFQEISVGAAHMCGLSTAGQAWCWGWNRYAGLGDGTTTDRYVPVLAAAGRPFTSVVAGDGNVIFTHSCGVTADGALFCWGSNSEGQLGVSGELQTCGAGAQARSCSPVALPVEGGLRFGAVDLGRQYTCGVSRQKRAYCWGENVYAQLGNSGVESRTSSPTPVSTWMKGRGRGVPEPDATAAITH